ncbi:MAG TPA: DNA alkylation repair protein [Candidatus Acidoferrum sp.]|nr:DNA alkylation repair protein [Candidatus Acidoferrum sp.]
MKARSRFSSTLKKRSKGPSREQTAGRWNCASVLRELKRLANPKVRAKMVHFGVNVPKAYGISQPVLHGLARRIGKKHELAEQLWISGIHEARILATLIGESEKVTSKQMERWAREFDAWDVVDAACCYLYAGAAPAWGQVEAWSRRREEFVKRAAFSLLAYLSYKDKQAPDARFERSLQIIEREAGDERNFVRKAVNWALRNIGKRNLRLNRAAIRAAERIGRQPSRSARWIAADALRELKSGPVRQRLRRKAA